MESVYIWGDSIMKGLIFDEIKSRYTLIKNNALSLAATALQATGKNFARIGMTSEKGREILDRHINECKKGSFAIIFFGGNDCDHDWPAIAADPTGKHSAKVTLDRFCENMKHMVTAAAKKGLQPLMMSLPPIDAERYYRWFSRDLEQSDNILQWLGAVDKIEREHSRYAAQVEAMAAALDCPLIDARQKFLNKRELLCCDGIHPNAAGQRLIAEAMVEFARDWYAQ